MARRKKSKKARVAKKRQAENLSQTRREHANEIAEDYVEAIADLLAELGEARVVELAKRLGVTHVTVNRTVARLQNAGLVTSQPYRAIFLTGKGRMLADQYVQAPPGSLKELLRTELCRNAGAESEYAMVVRAYLVASCGIDAT